MLENKDFQKSLFPEIEEDAHEKKPNKAHMKNGLLEKVKIMGLSIVVMLSLVASMEYHC